MTMPAIVIVGAGINGLVAANYLQRSGCDVTMIERAHRVGGACVSEIANVGGEDQCYALGASVFGHMQRFIYEDTGLARRLQVYISKHPELVHFFGDALTHLWISGTARSLLDHYFTSERMKIFTAMKVTESGPVSLDDPYTAFTLPLLNSGSIFDGDYGFVKSGIWRVTEELGAINDELEGTTHLSSKVLVLDVDAVHGNLTYERNGSEHRKDFDFLIFGTDPLTACRVPACGQRGSGRTNPSAAISRHQRKTESDVQRPSPMETQLQGCRI